jgi:uncharacterized protein (TIGR00730 family)
MANQPLRPHLRLPVDDDGIDAALTELLDLAGAVQNRDLLREILRSGVGLATDGADRLNLKITNAALMEMRAAFAMFAPYRDAPKVTIFGSARTLPDDPLYLQTRDLARELARQGWMVITGAGPGIMAAGLEGAGRANAFGINIRLPTEEGVSELLANDPKLVSMKYFFTRKLMLMKESKGFVALPGGFGTLDEVFELLTLQQTGKANPSPLVLLEMPGGTYWRAWERFLVTEVASRGLISPGDTCFYLITDDAAEAVTQVTGFFRNYHSLRFVGPNLIVRLQAVPTADELADLSERYTDICDAEGIQATDPLPAEVRSNDALDKPRVRLRFNRLSYSRLRQLIGDLNRLASAGTR